MQRMWRKELCEHGRIRSRCKDCGGDLFQHGRRRDNKRCGGGSVCEHDRIRLNVKNAKVGQFANMEDDESM